MSRRKKRFSFSGALTTVFFVVLDILGIILAGGIALWVRFDFKFSLIPREYINLWMHFVPFQIGITLAVFVLTKMYKYVWQTVGLLDVAKMEICVVIAWFACWGAGQTPFVGVDLPKSIDAMDFCLESVFMVGSRIFVRFADTFLSSRSKGNGGPRLMIVGGGEAGRSLIQESKNSRLANANVVCVIDDDPAKQGKYIDGVKIIGTRDDIIRMAEKYAIDEIVIALPTASKEDQQSIIKRCQRTGCKIRKVPGIYQLVNGDVTMNAVQDVRIEDLLGRDPVKLDTQALHGFIGGKTILVTGAGGSIGSELCRQIAKYNPGLLVMLDIYENNVYDIQMELKRTYGNNLHFTVEIASVRDKTRVYEIFEEYHPSIVFHAAAHKHVPLMEACPTEAVKNNIFGTYHVIRGAEKYGAQKFVMVSTDKAVNPTNIMGATKRFCEMIVQSKVQSNTTYCAVRFGNVLGSNGSVVPLFRKQIAEGGPITITDKRIIRYFMTIPEAASLVLEAGAMAERSQVFVLDMGQPVSILEMAENMVRLSGKEPYKDIEIVEVGLRPGEKLYEELLMSSNKLSKTANARIFVEQQEEINPNTILENLKKLDEAISTNQADDVLAYMVKKMVPTYVEPAVFNAEAIKKKEV